MPERRSLRDDPFRGEAEPDGGERIRFPDLPECSAVADTVPEVAAMAMDAKRRWIETEFERGSEIPLPSRPEAYSGTFNVRLPKSLYRRLAEAAAWEEVSLNQYVVSLLAEGLGQRTAHAGRCPGDAE